MTGARPTIGTVSCAASSSTTARGWSSGRTKTSEAPAGEPCDAGCDPGSCEKIAGVEKFQGITGEPSSVRLLPAEIARHLATKRIGRVIHHFDSIDSTNRHAMELARHGAAEGEVVIAEVQTAGRGRLGRSFFSPEGVSFYGSIILRPKVLPARAPQITLVAGLAVAEAVGKHAGIPPGLKWPNDVRLGPLKVAGILTEMESEGDRVLHVVCGPGINLNVPTAEFPAELRAVATSILASTGRTVDRAAFAADLFGSFEGFYDEFLARGLVRLRERWDAYSVLNGEWVRVEGAGQTLEGRVLGIDEEGALRLEGRQGRVVRAIAGDVTLKREEVTGSGLPATGKQQ